MSREWESYNVGRHLYLSKSCLESGLDDALVGTCFDEISRSLTKLDIHIESLSLTEADKIDEFLFDRLSEKEVAVLSLGVAVGMIQSILLSMGPNNGSIPKTTQGKLMGTIDLALDRIRMVSSEIEIQEIARPLVEHIQPLLGDLSTLKASSALLLSEIQTFEIQLKVRFEN